MCKHDTIFVIWLKDDNFDKYRAVFRTTVWEYAITMYDNNTMWYQSTKELKLMEYTFEEFDNLNKTSCEEITEDMIEKGRLITHRNIN